MSWLLDTCVISEFVKPRPEPKVLRFLAELDEDALFLSAMTIGEVHLGLALLEPGKRRREIEAWIGVDLRERFDGRILQFDEEVAREWGVVAARVRKAGRPMKVADSIIAATALHHGLTLVTRDERDFAATEVPMVNPWSGSYPSR